MAISHNYPAREKIPHIPPLILGVGLLIVGMGLLTLLLGHAPWDGILGNAQPQPLPCTSIDRNTYGVSPALFAELPEPPQCFFTVLQAYYSDNFHDPFFFSPAYYEQPEFYPRFLTEGLNTWRAPDPTHWGAVGYAIEPFDTRINLLPGEKKIVRLFLHSGFGVRTYQGIALHTVQEHNGISSHVHVRLAPQTEKGLLLAPNFPEFTPGWAIPVDVELTANEDAVNGSFQIRIETDSPEAKTREGFVNAHPNDYFDATSYVGKQTIAVITVNTLVP